jgi:HD superfamily phosphohydrolase
MRVLNEQFNGKLETAIAIFTDTYPKRFLSQLVSGQLDVDRMDYLNRDSFFTGVAEGVISYDRIIKMLVVKEGDIMVEEKAIFSIEKFLISRRLMYWQVYLHKTVLGAEMMLVRIIRRAKELIAKGIAVHACSECMEFFMQSQNNGTTIEKHLTTFCNLDDSDVTATIKNWISHPDKILSLLCRSLIERRLYKVQLQAQPIDEEFVQEKTKEVMKKLGLTEQEAQYFVFTGSTSNTTYTTKDEQINILFKDGTVKDISLVDNALIQHDQVGLAIGKIKKHYICYWRI